MTSAENLPRNLAIKSTAVGQENVALLTNLEKELCKKGIHDVLDYVSQLPLGDFTRLIAEGPGIASMMHAMRAWRSLATTLIDLTMRYGQVIWGLSNLGTGLVEHIISMRIYGQSRWLSHTAETADVTAKSIEFMIRARVAMINNIVGVNQVLVHVEQLRKLQEENILDANVQAIEEAERVILSDFVKNHNAFHGYADAANGASRLPLFSNPPWLELPMPVDPLHQISRITHSS